MYRFDNFGDSIGCFKAVAQEITALYQVSYLVFHLLDDHVPC
jgi:hypothetical protein